jgi:hypothetical protein
MALVFLSDPLKRVEEKPPINGTSVADLYKCMNYVFCVLENKTKDVTSE